MTAQPDGLNLERLRAAIRAFTSYETVDIPEPDGRFRRVPLADAIAAEYARLQGVGYQTHAPAGEDGEP